MSICHRIANFSGILKYFNTYSIFIIYSQSIYGYMIYIYHTKLFDFFIYYQICNPNDVYHYVIASVGIQIYQLNQNETIFTTDFHSKFRLFGKKIWKIFLQLGWNHPLKSHSKCKMPKKVTQNGAQVASQIKNTRAST